MKNSVALLSSIIMLQFTMPTQHAMAAGQQMTTDPAGNCADNGQHSLYGNTGKSAWGYNCLQTLQSCSISIGVDLTSVFRIWGWVSAYEMIVTRTGADGNTESWSYWMAFQDTASLHNAVAATLANLNCPANTDTSILSQSVSGD